MIRRIIKRYGWRKILSLLADFICFEIAAVVTLIVYHNGEEFVWPRSISVENGIIFIVASILSLIVFRTQGLYKERIASHSSRQLKRLLRSAVVTFGLILFLQFIIKPSDVNSYSRAQIIEFVFLSYFFIATVRFFVFHGWGNKNLFTKINHRNVLVIGAGEAGYNFAQEIKKTRGLGFHVVGFVDDDPSLIHTPVDGYQVLGTVGDLEELTEQYDIDELFIAIKSIGHEELLLLVERCRTTGCQINILSDHFGIIEKKVGDQEYRDVRFVALVHADESVYTRYYKRLIDLSIATLITIVLSPFFILVALLIKLTTSGPIFYRATVIGKRGRPFKLYKFRSMYHNVSNLKHKELVKEFMSGQIDGAKLRFDPRVTPIGKFIRRYSIDEFPQLINVFRGEMSLVGPRPSTTYEYEMMEDWHRNRFRTLPGMTGVWQATGRAEVSFIDMIMMDIYYTQSCSFWLDMTLLYKTISVVLGAKGGY